VADEDDQIDAGAFIDDTVRTNTLKGRHRNYYEGRARRDAFLALVRAGSDIMGACTELGVSQQTYRSWRRRWPQFGAEIDSARVSAKDAHSLRVGWTGGFAEFRKAYFGMDSPWFHLEIIDAIEHAEPGSITLILLPPEHGKTTLLEDFVNYKLATDPSYRFTYGSERIHHGEKVSGRVRGRMEVDGPCADYVSRFGPFAPQAGEDRTDQRKSRQPWGDRRFNVYKKGNHDERDYSFVAIGIGAAIAGTRTDRLIIDDVQSLKSLTQTDKIVEVLRQDWFSRPGTKGSTIIVGTRVGDLDVYQALMDATRPDGTPLLHRVIVYPAVRPDPTGQGEKLYLWPERYSPAEYELMEGTVGPEAWSRNYQQRPRVKGQASFTAEIIAGCDDPMRSWYMDPPADAWGVGLSIDPALGGQNVVLAAALGPKLTVLDSQGDYGLVRTEQIISVAADFCARWHGRGLPITDVVIEEMAFQRGLPNDERLKELQRQYGFNIRPHQTNNNKNDPNLGVTAMALSMIRTEIVLPAATDEATTGRIQPLRDELLRWRPHVRGTKLKMDRVMALWFLWLLWRQRKPSLLRTGQGPAAMQGEGLPFTPMLRPTLLVPTTLSRP
jgi:hypothetical protein